MDSQSSAGALHMCRWAWCRETFQSDQDMYDHVIQDHVARIIPVRLRDIPMLEAAERGWQQTLSLPGQQKSLASSSQQTSLPSPAASSPAEPTFATPVDGHAPSDMYETKGLYTPRSQRIMRHPSPTFASLSSPAVPRTKQFIPPSPSLHEMVHAKKKKRFEETPSEVTDSDVFPPASQASVEAHLTQVKDMMSDLDPASPSPFTGPEPVASDYILSENHLSLDPLEPWDDVVSAPDNTYMSQPPSQFQQEPPAEQSAEAEPQPSLPVPSTPPALATPGFVSSTPAAATKAKRSASAQPPSRRTRSQSREPLQEPKRRSTRSTSRSASRGPTNKTGARSGIRFQAQSILEPQLEEAEDEEEQFVKPRPDSQTDDSQNSSFSQREYPPLMTQAPYQSQPFSQESA